MQPIHTVTFSKPVKLPKGKLETTVSLLNRPQKMNPLMYADYDKRCVLLENTQEPSFVEVPFENTIYWQLDGAPGKSPVARGPDKCKAAAGFPVTDFTDQAENTANGQSSGLIGLLGSLGIQIKGE